MKKTILSLLALAVTALTFTACSDVPEPYQIPGTGGNSDGGEVAGATGSGQLTDPYNCVAANATGGTADWVYIKGKVSSIKEEYSTQYGNGTFYISDDGTRKNEFYVYRAYYLGNKKFASSDTQIKVGDEVIICGIITNYNGTIETTQNKGFIYELNGVNRGGDPTGSDQTGGEQKGTGTESDPFNVAAAVAKCKAVGETASAESYYIKGIADDDYTVDNFKNVTIDLVDQPGASEKFKIYRAKAADNKNIKEGYKINKGATIVVYGKVVNYYGNTPETVQNEAYIVSVDGQAPEVEGGSDTPTPTPTGEAKAVSIAEFNAAEVNDNVWYQLTGTVKNLKDNDQYGNFDLEDATGSVYVYGLLSEKGGAKKLFQELVAAKGIANGSKITIIGTRGEYKGKIEVMNAYFVSIEGGSNPDSGNGQGSDTEVTSLVNGGFETWADGVPTGWKSASTASSATLAQSTDAHGGQYSVNVNGKESSNVRLASQEIKLAAGTYTFSFWAKATTADASQARPGYVPVTDGKVGSYAYGEYVNLTTTWQQFSHEFTLDAETTVCLVVMNPKASSYSSGKDILIDDATLTKK